MLNIANMAYPKKQAESKIDGLQRPINLHLIKLVKWDDKVNFSKHSKDIDTWLKDIQDITIKPKGKQLSKEDYYKLMFEQPLNPERVFFRIIGTTLESYKNLPVRNSDYETYIKVKSIHLSLADILSKGTYNYGALVSILNALSIN